MTVLLFKLILLKYHIGTGTHKILIETFFERKMFSHAFREILLSVNSSVFIQFS